MKIGLALSGGGALGAAHIGVLKELEKNKIKIDSICGTSAGAIVGLLYADGGLESIEQFFDLITQKNIFSLKNIVISRSTEKLFNQIEEILRQIVKANNFSELKIKYSCIATNYETGDLAIMSSGDPIKCALASAAYPGVFPIQKINEKYYIDGGVNLNLPVSPLKKLGMNFIIASSIYALPKVDLNKKNIGSRLQAAMRALEIMERRISEYELKQADFIFKPSVGKYNWYNFLKMNKIRKIGEKYASQRIKKLILEN